MVGDTNFMYIHPPLKTIDEMAESRQGCEQKRATGQTVMGKLWICGGGSPFGLLHVSVPIEERRGTEGKPGGARD